MNRFLAVWCIVWGLFVLGCGPVDNAKPAAGLSQPGRPPKQGKETADAAGSVAPAHQESRPEVSPTEENTEPASFDDAPPPEKSSAGAVLLTPADFTYVGSYPFSADGQATFGMGLTHHRVKGQLRFLTISYTGSVKARLIEFALPEKLGQEIKGLTGSWDNIWSPGPAPNLGGGDEYSLWMETLPNGSTRLWTTHATDYPSDGTGLGQASCPLAISVRTLKSDGKITDFRGEYGMEGIGQRAIYGGVQPIPKWFRDKNGIDQRYLVGWGGCASRMAQGLGPSLGFMAVAIPDLTTYKANSVLPTKEFKIFADHRSGARSARDWYASGKPTFDRGRRNADVVNYLDSGDPRQNPSTPPSGPPAATAQWKSPAPDGFGRFVWSDSFYNTGCWIDGPNKGGFIAIGTFARGKAFYMRSAPQNEGRHAELQIFDPNDFGKVIRGEKSPVNLEPAASKLLTKDLEPLKLLYAKEGNGPNGAVAGATFDARTKLLYLWCPSVNSGYGCCLVVYKVNC